jgi:hypothetical protein
VDLGLEVRHDVPRFSFKIQVVARFFFAGVFSYLIMRLTPENRYGIKTTPMSFTSRIDILLPPAPLSPEPRAQITFYEPEAVPVPQSEALVTVKPSLLKPRTIIPHLKRKDGIYSQLQPRQIYDARLQHSKMAILRNDKTEISAFYNFEMTSTPDVTGVLAMHPKFTFTFFWPEREEFVQDVDLPKDWEAYLYNHDRSVGNFSPGPFNPFYLNENDYNKPDAFLLPDGRILVLLKEKTTQGFELYLFQKNFSNKPKILNTCIRNIKPNQKTPTIEINTDFGVFLLDVTRTGHQASFRGQALSDLNLSESEWERLGFVYNP